MPIWFDGVETVPRVTMFSGDRIQMSPRLTVDHSCTGEEIALQTAGADISDLGVVFYATDKKWYPSLASVPDSCNGFLGLATFPVEEGDMFSVLLRGYARNDDWNLSIGSPVFISNANPGEILDVVPLNLGDIVRVVGYAVDVNTIWFRPSGTYIQVG
jgi:hypothetical protein